jgi:hypothetical protein
LLAVFISLPRYLQLYISFIVTYHPVNKMVQIIPYIASLLALGQAVAAAKQVTSFTEWIDGIVANPDGDNMTPDEVLEAFNAGKFSTPPEGMSAIRSIFCA